MNQTRSQSALGASAVYLRGLFAVLWSGLGRFGAELDPWRAIDDWVGGVFRKLEAMLVLYQAGKLAAVSGVDAEAPRSGEGQAVGTPRAVAVGQARDRVAVPRHVAGEAAWPEVEADWAEIAVIGEVRVDRAWSEAVAGTAVWRASGGLELGFFAKNGLGWRLEFCSECSG